MVVGDADILTLAAPLLLLLAAAQPNRVSCPMATNKKFVKMSVVYLVEKLPLFTPKVVGNFWEGKIGDFTLEVVGDYVQP